MGKKITDKELDEIIRLNCSQLADKHGSEEETISNLKKHYGTNNAESLKRPVLLDEDDKK